MPRVVVYSDYVCPFCYLAEPGLARLRGEGVETGYRAFELCPAPAPLPLPDDPGEDALWERTLLPLARAIGVEMRRPARRPRSRKAHEAARVAAEKGLFQPVHDAIFRAYFAEGRDIGRIDVLVEIGVAQGLERLELEVALGVDRWADEVAAEEAAALESGITGVPTFVLGEDVLVGLQPYEVLRRWVRGESDET